MFGNLTGWSKNCFCLLILGTYLILLPANTDRSCNNATYLEQFLFSEISSPQWQWCHWLTALAGYTSARENIVGLVGKLLIITCSPKFIVVSDNNDVCHIYVATMAHQEIYVCCGREEN